MFSADGNHGRFGVDLANLGLESDDPVEDLGTALRSALFSLSDRDHKTSGGFDREISTFAGKLGSRSLAKNAVDALFKRAGFAEPQFSAARLPGRLGLFVFLRCLCLLFARLEGGR